MSLTSGLVEFQRCGDNLKRFRGVLEKFLLEIKLKCQGFAVMLETELATTLLCCCNFALILWKLDFSYQGDLNDLDKLLGLK